MAINLSKVREDDVYRFVIRPGDTLESLSALLEVEIEALLAANPHVRADGIVPGVELIIPLQRSDDEETPAFPLRGSAAREPIAGPELAEPASDTPAELVGSTEPAAHADREPAAPAKAGVPAESDSPETAVPAESAEPVRAAVREVADALGVRAAAPPATGAAAQSQETVQAPGSGEERAPERPRRARVVEWRPFPKV